MTIRGLIQSPGDFGTSNFKKERSQLNHHQKWLAVGLISLFVILSVIADLSWPLKNTYAFFDIGSRSFNMLNQITPDMRYSGGGSGMLSSSLIWTIALKLFYSIIPSRMLCLRVMSLFFSCLSLVLLFRVSIYLFSRIVAFIFLFLLVTSPIYVESMRAFGWNSLSCLVVVTCLYLLAFSLNNKKVVLKTVLLAFFSILTLSLYLIGRLIIFLPIIFSLIYIKTGWRRLFLYLFLLTGFILIIDFSFKSRSFNPKEFLSCSIKDVGFEFTGPAYEWLGTRDAEDPEEIKKYELGQWNRIESLKHNLWDNIQYALGYFAGFNRVHFSDKDWHSRLFNIVYTPFLLLGIAICLIRRNRSTILLLLLFGLFFLMPLFSSRIEPRRLLFSLVPIYLLIALGIRFVYLLLLNSRSLTSYWRRFKYLLLALLILLGSYDICEFLFEVSKPSFNYSRSRLKKMADEIIALGEDSDTIKYNWISIDLIWGNPYLVKHPGSLDLKWMGPYERTGFRESLEEAEKRGERLLYLYALCPHPYYTEGGFSSIDSNLSRIRKHYPNSVSFSRVAGTELNYLLFDGTKKDSSH